MKTLSIIIPYYKTLPYTKKLFKVLEPQLTEEVEVLLIDDGCHEKELDKLKAKVIHLDHPSGNASYPRNIGLDKATGKYIAFIDSDDNVSDRYIETILNKIKKSTFDYCFFSWDWSRGEIIINDIPPAWNTSIWNCVYKRDIIGDTRFDCNKNVAEDEDFNKKVRYGKRENIKDILYHYNNGREGSLTTRFSKGEIGRDTIKCGLLVYQKYISKIGGIETFLYEFFKALCKDYDILFVYKEGDPNQLSRYRKYVKCLKFNNQSFICDKYLCVSNQDNIANSVTALMGDYYDMIHADFSAMGWKYKGHPKITKHIAVSNIAKKGMNCDDGKPVEVIYNLLELTEPKKPIRIMSAQRFSVEKGEQEMKMFANRLTQRNIPFIWVCFTDNKTGEDSGILFKEPVTNTADYFKAFDYFASFSRTESYGYSLVEAMSYGLPLIVRDIPVLQELGFKEGEHGYVLKMDMSNMDAVIDNMLSKTPTGKYTKLDSVEPWYKLFGKLNRYNDYNNERNMDVKVRCIVNSYKDVVLGKQVVANDEFITDYDRAIYLCENNAVEILEFVPKRKDH